MTDLYADARSLAAAAFADDEPAANGELPEQCPYAWDDVIGRGSDWLPERA